MDQGALKTIWFFPKVPFRSRLRKHLRKGLPTAAAFAASVCTTNWENVDGHSERPLRVDEGPEHQCQCRILSCNIHPTYKGLE